MSDRIDLHSGTWRSVAAALEQSRERDLRLLLTPGWEHGPTEYLRGRLALADEILALGKEPPARQVASHPDTPAGY